MTKLVRLALATLFLACLSVHAEDKKPDVDKAKLLGTWEAVKGSETVPLGSTLEFTKDGKLKLVIKDGDNTAKIDGTFEVKADSFKATLKIDGDDKSEVLKVDKLTDKDLVIIDEKGKKDVFSKKK